MQMALMKVWAQRSYRVAMRRQSLSLPEHALDAVALLVEVCVVGDRRLAVRPARDAGLDLEIGQGLAEPVAVVALVGDQDIGVQQFGSAVDAPR